MIEDKVTDKKGELLFEFRPPDAEAIRIYSNGVFTGLPEGTGMVNCFTPLLGALRGYMLKQGVDPAIISAARDIFVDAEEFISKTSGANLN